VKRKSVRRQKRPVAKTVPRLPDLEVAKSSVLNSLSCPDAQRGYRHAIDEFVDWYCSEPRLSFSKTVVVRYRMHLESRQRRSGRRNQARQRCKETGSQIGQLVDGRTGARTLAGPDTERLKGKRDRALPGILLACGLRRHEVAELSVDHLQQREGHWAIVDLSGKAGHVRTVPVPDWVYSQLSEWITAAGVETGKVFRRVSSAGRPWAKESPKSWSGTW
jgi:integrase